MNTTGNICTENSSITKKKYTNDLIKELIRKSIHLCSAFLPFFFNKIYWVVIISLSVVLVVYILAEFSRYKGKNIPLISTITAVAARKRDENKFVLGPVTLALGILITELLWNPIPAAIGIYALAFGDGLASLSGKLFGRVHIPLTKGKTVAGSLTCFTAIFISSFLTEKSVIIALILATTGMIIEVLPLKDFDNLIIPVCIAGLAQFLL